MRGAKQGNYLKSAAVKQVLLVQPSSAAAERAFSLLSAAFSDQQDSALADYPPGQRSQRNVAVQ